MSDPKDPSRITCRYCRQPVYPESECWNVGMAHQCKKESDVTDHSNHWNDDDRNKPIADAQASPAAAPRVTMETLPQRLPKSVWVGGRVVSAPSATDGVTQEIPVSGGTAVAGKTLNVGGQADGVTLSEAEIEDNRIELHISGERIVSKLYDTDIDDLCDQALAAIRLAARVEELERENRLCPHVTTPGGSSVSCARYVELERQRAEAWEEKFQSECGKHDATVKRAMDAERDLAAERAIPRACRALEQEEVGAPCPYRKDAEDQLSAAQEEIERWKNFTARKDPDDCAVGIKELYDNWQNAKEERDAVFACRDRATFEIHELNAKLGVAQEERNKVLPLLQRIARGPVMPLPDPLAHSWQAFGTRAHSALCDSMSLANEAIRALKDKP